MSLEKKWECFVFFSFLSLVVGDTGSIGGSLSHEYHFPAQIGEDELFNCKICGLGANGETTGRC